MVRLYFHYPTPLSEFTKMISEWGSQYDDPWITAQIVNDRIEVIIDTRLGVVGNHEHNPSQ